MESLGVDGKLILAQIINFCILWFLMSKILYKPLLKLLNDRTKKISEDEEKHKSLSVELEQLKHKEAEIIHEATKKAREETQELLDIAKGESAKIIADAKKASESEKQRAIAEIKAQSESAYADIKNKFLADVSDKVVEKLKSKSGKPVIKELLGE